MLLLLTVHDRPRKIIHIVPFFLFLCQQYATMDNSSLISYYNTQNALKVKLHWRNNPITTHKHVLLFMSQVFNTRVCLISYI
jgi:hypothetical protein